MAADWQLNYGVTSLLVVGEFFWSITKYRFSIRTFFFKYFHPFFIFFFSLLMCRVIRIIPRNFSILSWVIILYVNLIFLCFFFLKFFPPAHWDRFLLIFTVTHNQPQSNCSVFYDDEKQRFSWNSYFCFRHTKGQRHRNPNKMYGHAGSIKSLHRILEIRQGDARNVSKVHYVETIDLTAEAIEPVRQCSGHLSSAIFGCSKHSHCSP